MWLNQCDINIDIRYTCFKWLVVVICHLSHFGFQSHTIILDVHVHVIWKFSNNLCNILSFHIVISIKVISTITIKWVQPPLPPPLKKIMITRKVSKIWSFCPISFEHMFVFVVSNLRSTPIDTPLKYWLLFWH